MTHPTRGFIGSYTHADLVVFAALVASAVFVAAMIIPAPCMVGAYQDDGVYLVTAKALADGQGYRHLELPGEPFQTKYPILYPLFLALIWRIFPNFPDNVTVIQLVNIVTVDRGVVDRLSPDAACVGTTLVAAGLWRAPGVSQHHDSRTASDRYG